MTGLCRFRGFLVWALLAFVGGGVQAKPPSDLLSALGVPETPGAPGTWREIQTDLAWIGLYEGPVTDRSDPDTLDAVRRFQTSLGAPPSGRLSASERAVLAGRSRATQDGYRFTTTDLDWLGMRVELPQAILQRPEIRGDDHDVLSYRTYHGASLEFRFQAFRALNATPAQFLRALQNVLKKADEKSELKILAARALASSAYVIAESPDWRTIWVAQKRDGSWRELRLRHAVSKADAMRPMLHRVLRSLDLFAGPVLSDSARNRRFRDRQDPMTRGYPEWYLTMSGNGSGSIVSRDGHILTNHHVIAGCARLTVNGAPASALASDVRLDLALIRSDAVSGRTPVRFRRDNPHLGEAISVMGYPIFSTSPSMNYTRGYVSSVVGLRGDRTNVQITAPVQPGNSGGPVLDSSGRQIAVVVSKLSTGFQADKNAENVAFVIRGRQAVEFLERHGQQPIVEDRTARVATPSPEDVSRWRQVTVRIECHRR